MSVVKNEKAKSQTQITSADLRTVFNIAVFAAGTGKTPLFKIFQSYSEDMSNHRYQIHECGEISHTYPIGGIHNIECHFKSNDRAVFDDLGAEMISPMHMGNKLHRMEAII